MGGGVSRGIAANSAILLSVLLWREGQPVIGAIRASADAFHERIPGTLIKEQRALSSDEVFVQILSRRPHQENVIIPAVPEPLIVWIVSGEALVEERELGGAWKKNHVVAGGFFLTTATLPTEMRWRAAGTQPFEVMHVYIGVNLLKLAVQDIQGKPDHRFALREVSGSRDGVLSSLLEKIKLELMGQAVPSNAYIHGLAQAMMVHLVCTFQTERPAEMGPRGGLQAYKLHRVFDAMKQRLHEPFVLDQFAELAELSPFHFSRVFKQSTGMSPSRYFIALRMDRARDLLDHGGRSIIEVSLAVGYASPGHFSGLFKATTGSSPSEYRLARSRSGN